MPIAVRIVVDDAITVVLTMNMAMSFGRNLVFNANVSMVQWIVNIIVSINVHNSIAPILIHRRIDVVQFVIIIIMIIATLTRRHVMQMQTVPMNVMVHDVNASRDTLAMHIDTVTILMNVQMMIVVVVVTALIVSTYRVDIVAIVYQERCESIHTIVSMLCDWLDNK
jgi:hypothetical protein